MHSVQPPPHVLTREKDEPPEPVIPDGAVYLIGGFVLCLVVGSLLFMAYVMISESAAVGGARKWQVHTSHLRTHSKKARPSEQVNFLSSASWLHLSPYSIMHQPSWFSWLHVAVPCSCLLCCSFHGCEQHFLLPQWTCMSLSAYCDWTKHLETFMLEQELGIFTCSLLTRTMFIWAFRYFVQK